MRSTGSSVSRRPAVSVSTMRTPSMAMLSESVSRVVPGTSVTMARSPPTSALSSVLLPAFGLPASTTRSPSSSMRPARGSQASRSRAAMSAQRSLTCALTSVSSTSSGKSTAAESEASTSMIASRASRTNADTPPSICLRALRIARSLPARIIRMTASACVRSTRPLIKARYVNSPGPAMRAPARSSSDSTRPTSACEPWHWISATSSRV